MKIVHLLSISLFTCSLAFTQTEVYNEDFQTGMPAGITIINNDGLTPDAAVAEYSDAWIIVADPDNLTDSIVSSTSFFSPTGTADRWLITPSITLGDHGNYLYWKGRSQDASYPDSYQILVSTTDTQISSFTDTLDAVSSEFEAWTSREINLSELGYDELETIHIAFVNRTNDGFKLYLDDIRVEINDPRGLRPADLDELSNNTLSVFPNPTSGTITIGLDNVDLVELFNLEGKLILSESANQLDLSLIEPGHYTLRTTSANRIYFNKIVKN